jgi:hypothetical protein
MRAHIGGTEGKGKFRAPRMRRSSRPICEPASPWRGSGVTARVRATRSAGPAGRPWRRGERHETVLASRHDDDRRNRESGFEAPSERARGIRAWFEEFDSARFDDKLERDIKAGKLDRIADRALAEQRRGRTREL